MIWSLGHHQTHFPYSHSSHSLTVPLLCQDHASTSPPTTVNLTTFPVLSLTSLIQAMSLLLGSPIIITFIALLCSCLLLSFLDDKTENYFCVTYCLPSSKFSASLTLGGNQYIFSYKRRKERSNKTLEWSNVELSHKKISQKRKMLQ